MKRNPRKVPAMAKALNADPPPAQIQVGRVVIGPASPALPSKPPQFVSPISHSMVGQEVMVLKATLNRLRKVRDERSYLSEGCHSFREWTMREFGERIGAFVEENL